jgi:hypothetical protein
MAHLVCFDEKLDGLIDPDEASKRIDRVDHQVLQHPPVNGVRTNVGLALNRSADHLCLFVATTPLVD